LAYNPFADPTPQSVISPEAQRIRDLEQQIRAQQELRKKQEERRKALEEQIRQQDARAAAAASKSSPGRTMSSASVAPTVASVLTSGIPLTEAEKAAEKERLIQEQLRLKKEQRRLQALQEVRAATELAQAQAQASGSDKLNTVIAAQVAREKAASDSMKPPAAVISSVSAPLHMSAPAQVPSASTASLETILVKLYYSTGDLTIAAGNNAPSPRGRADSAAGGALQSVPGGGCT
jgi:membrane protein involved in colicin uptake